MADKASDTVPTDYQSSLARIAELSKVKSGALVHIIGICGTGTAAVASLLKQRGFRVQGSDKSFYPPMGEFVRGISQRVFEGYSASNLSDRPDVVIIGNSVSRGNEEVEAALKLGVPYASMPEALRAFLIGDYKFCETSIVVAGTHGKTTTSALIATLLDRSGLEPGYFIGGIVPELSGNIRPASSRLPSKKRTVVLEGDEYDSAFFAKWPKFHSYRADLLVVTSLEFDHGDIYDSLDQIEAEFTRLVMSVPPTGAVFVCDEGGKLSEVLKLWRESETLVAKLYTYGTREKADFRLVERKSVTGSDGQPPHQSLRVRIGGEELELHTRLSGLHNALNVVAAAAVGVRIGLSHAELASALAAFEGVLRRQQILTTINDIVVIEDFAHHPTAILATLKGIRETYPTRRLVAVYEPRSNTGRRDYFQKEYASSFAPADLSVILEVKDAGGYSKSDQPITALNVGKIISELHSQKKNAESKSDVPSLEEFLLAELKSGDVVVIMSNGDFGGLMKNLVRSLHERYEKKGSPRCG